MTSHQIIIAEELSDLLERFWHQEDINEEPQSTLTAEEIDCEKHFATTHKRTSEGRYVLRLPFKQNISDLRDSYSSALSMLQRMERRFDSTPKLYEKYCSFLEEYMSLNHMRESVTIHLESQEIRYFLHHYGVFKATDKKGKLRVVFNGAARLHYGLTLNECLHIGPKLQTDVRDILQRWRIHRYFCSVYIEKMFRQIFIDEANQYYQKILWHSSRKQTVRTFCLTTVTYGLASSPYQAIRTPVDSLSNGF